MKRITKTIAMPLLAVSLLTLSACGDSRPDAEAVSKVLQKDFGEGADMPKESADCFAEVLVDSKLSDEALKTMVETKTKEDADNFDKKLSKADQEVFESKEIQDEIIKCLGLDELMEDMPTAPSTPDVVPGVEGDFPDNVAPEDGFSMEEGTDGASNDNFSELSGSDGTSSSSSPSFSN